MTEHVCAIVVSTLHIRKSTMTIMYVPFVILDPPLFVMGNRLSTTENFSLKQNLKLKNYWSRIKDIESKSNLRRKPLRGNSYLMRE